MPRPNLKPLQKRSKESASRILQAAVEVITEVGIQDFTMGGVAEAARISVGGLYGRYPDKDSLLYAVKDNVLTDLTRTVEDSLDGSEPTVRAVIQAYVGTLSRVLFGAERLYAFIFVHSAHDDRLRSRGFAFHRDLRAALVGKLRTAGVVDAGALATTYEIIVQSLLMRVISLGHSNTGNAPYEGFPSPDEYAVWLTDYVCRALVDVPIDGPIPEAPGSGPATTHE
ncbi:MAG: TetR/AcrR family transcriptional regulator [Rhodococcus sp. (in: high G+C Gram-positive bacteria)]